MYLKSGIDDSIIVIPATYTSINYVQSVWTYNIWIVVEMIIWIDAFQVIENCLMHVK